MDRMGGFYTQLGNVMASPIELKRLSICRGIGSLGASLHLIALVQPTRNRIFCKEASHREVSVLYKIGVSLYIVEQFDVWRIYLYGAVFKRIEDA